jgi:methionine-rich copper-binding protein CopC
MSSHPTRSLSSLVTVALASATVVIGAVAAHASVGTAAEPAVQAAPTASPTATVTRIDEATAYWFCRATVYRWAYRNPDVDPFTVNTFAKASITERGAGWRVVIVGKPHTAYGAHTKADFCDVAGTAAHPKLVGGLMPR